MRLSEYLRVNEVTLADFAGQVGRSAATISRIARGVNDPDAETLRQIVRATNGAVTPNDFFGFDPPAADAPTRDGTGVDDGVGGVSAAGPVQPDQEAA